MTTTKKKYVKPTMTVIEAEPERIICSSMTFSRYNQNESDIEDWNGEFE